MYAIFLTTSDECDGGEVSLAIARWLESRIARRKMEGKGNLSRGLQADE
jgi:hypothetical protein